MSNEESKLQVFIPKELHQSLKVLAARKGVSIKSLIMAAVIEIVKEEK